MVIFHSYVNVYQRVPPPVCFSYLVPFGTLSDGIQPLRFMDRAIPDALMIGLVRACFCTSPLKVAQLGLNLRDLNGFFLRCVLLFVLLFWLVVRHSPDLRRLLSLVRRVRMLAASWWVWWCSLSALISPAIPQVLLQACQWQNMRRASALDRRF